MVFDFSHKSGESRISIIIDSASLFYFVSVLMMSKRSGDDRHRRDSYKRHRSPTKVR